ncbi:hypothetical protein RFI_12773 [Reticulomyxa filosa]|uniref:FCP1 homology domain-containing protein n=1 Tax=Reticulomyxa filosa TaxID=46433 RepID=X6NDL3_RETFI|nr:hypothetical protein RFI_12773 [Reticulomyxa filosa]|eukprot:ETO24385.1 hypothetical protein RFI_12773 [Reticulomyxa filosa]
MSKFSHNTTSDLGSPELYQLVSRDKTTTEDQKKAIKLIGFDFDLTLTSFRIFGEKKDFENGEELMGGKYRVEALKKLLKYLKFKKNCWLIAISWNHASVMKQFLTQPSIQMLDLFDKIYDRKFVQAFGGYVEGKGKLLQYMCNVNKLALSQVLFIDDSQEILQKIHPDISTKWIKGEHGIQKKDIDDILHVWFNDAQTEKLSK